MNTTIVIADDHPLMLRGLSDFLKSKGYKILGSAEDGQTAYNLIVKLKPEIAILDIRMPYKTGLEIAEECVKNNLNTKIILITFDKEEELYDKALELGIYGYILKEFAIEEIEACLENVKKGLPYFSEEISSHLNPAVASPSIIDLLTKTEKKIVKLISEDQTSQEISETLFIAVSTVNRHRHNIIDKLGLDQKPTSLIIWAKINKNLL